MFRHLGRPALRAVGSLAGGLAAASTLPVRSDAAPSTPTSGSAATDVAPQWLWSSDGVQLRRDEHGQTRFVDEATGHVLGERPLNVPPEAYERRWRSSHAWSPAVPAPKDAPKGRGRVARHLLLVRHAQYDLQGRTDAERVLTPLGQRQSALVAERLHAIDAAAEGFYKKFELCTLVSSGMTRAIQTAEYILPKLPAAPGFSRRPELNEGRPCLPEPSPSHAADYTNRNGDAERIEGAFRSLCS